MPVGAPCNICESQDEIFGTITRINADGSGRDPKFVDALYFKAGLRHAAGQIDEAAALYGQITAIDPSQVLAHLAAARVQLQKGDLDAADKAVKAAESLTPKNPLVMYSRGILELQRGRLDRQRHAAKVLAVVPNDLASLLAHAVASHGLGNFEQSINKAKRVLARDADNLLATKILASGQLQSKDAKGALATLEPALAAHPDDPQLVALAGDAYLWTGDYAKAMSYLNRAVALEPQSATIKTSRATGHLVAGNTEQALTDLEQAVRLNAQLGQADLQLVTLRLKRKEYDQALSDIAALEKKLPNNPVTHELRASALVGQEDRAGARKALEQALAIQPTFFSAALSLARLDIQDGNPALARQRFESILARDEKNVEAMLALAELSAFEKKEGEYLSWLDRAIQADPRQIKPRAALVQHHLARREMQKALAAAQDAAASNPEEVDAVSLLGSVQLAAGDSMAAIETFSGIARKLPQSRPGPVRRQRHADRATAGMPALVAVLMGVITSVFGGVLRDIVCNQIPSAFSDHRPYALCAFAGGWVLVAVQRAGVGRQRGTCRRGAGGDRAARGRHVVGLAATGLGRGTAALIPAAPAAGRGRGVSGRSPPPCWS